MVNEISSNENHNRSSDLPKGWVLPTLGDISNIESGIGFPEKYQGRQEGDVPFYKVMDISKTVKTGGLYLTKSDNYVSFCDLALLKGKLIKKNSIVFAKIGAAIALNRRALLTTDSLIDNNIMSVYCNPVTIATKYLYYFLLTKKLGELSRATTVPSIRKSDVEEIFFPLAPLPEQHRIVAKIEELFTQLDAGVASLKKAQAQLKRYRQAVLKAAFDGRLTLEWREEHKGEIESAEILLERYSIALKKRSNGKIKLPSPPDSSELEHLPDLWTWTKIGMFIEIVRGASPRPAGSPRYFGGNIPWITVGELTKDENVYLKNVSSFVTEEGKEKSRFIHANTLLLTNSGATLGVPKITLIAGCINDGSVALLGLDDTPKLYLYFYLKSQTKRLRQINQGAAQPNLNTDIVRNIIVPLPPLEEQKEVINEIERHFSQIDHLERIMETSLRQADSLRQSILKQAFEGKLVPQDPNDEPASILLERIKAEKARHTAETKKGKTLQPKPSKRKIKNGN